VPASIKKRGYVSAAMDASYPPDEFVAANGTTIIGMDADFNAALGAVMASSGRRSTRSSAPSSSASGRASTT